MSRATLAVDARGLRQSGIGRYLREVLGGVFADARFRRVVLLGRPEELEPFVEEHGAGRVARVVPFPYHFYSAPAQLHWAALQAGGDLRSHVTFFPHYDVVLTDRSPRSVVTVHDLSHFKVAGQFPGWKRALASRVLARAVRRAQRVLVVSEWTRGDLLERHPEIGDKVEVIPSGVTALRAAGAERGRAEEVAGRGPFLLAVGNLKPHKNLVAAVETLARVRRRIPGALLVLVGEEFGEEGGVRERVRALGLEEAVVWFGRATDGELAHLYASAACLLFPSLYEGFGFPPLEAMSVGLPVIASDRSAIPEVVGDAAVLVGPHEWDAMAEAAVRLVEDPAHRAEMVRRGRARAALFRWEKTAGRVADLLWDAAGRGRAAEPVASRARRERSAAAVR